MQERGLVGLEARTASGDEVIGRIVGVLTDEESGELTHVVVETPGEQMEVPITSLTLDPEADFATFDADPSDVEPGDHVGDEDRPLGYAPSRSFGPEDHPHEGQFVGAPEDESLAQSPEDLGRGADEAGGFEDEGSTPTDSGYPRNDAYIDPDTGMEVERYPAEGEDLRSDVEQVLDGVDLRVRGIVEGLVEVEGRISSRADLDSLLAEIRELEGVVDVDATDVDATDVDAG